MLARCSMTVVTMWLPFSLHISAAPLRARLIASVPPEVNTSSFGSRAPPQLPLSYLRALRVLQARHDVDRSLQRRDHLPAGDLRRRARRRVAALGPVGAAARPLLGEPLEDLGHELRRDRELLGNPLGAHRTEAVVDGDIMNRHQPVIGALGESKHSVTRPCLSIPLYRR